ncbi:hypothetical protein ABMA28_016989 [Loxostege sticticalis]|uniref:Uncharacterized protein n=1 Tax=Loxostege sticticalis TaxID=481309 RepID=A0ABD0T6K4_LOXSC
MMTRKAKAMDTESKLQRALEELKASRETCNQLLREREDSEEEINKIIFRNTELKKDLADLHVQYQETAAHRDQLLTTISSFDQCSAVFEQALIRNNELESELRDANNTILHFEEGRKLQECSQTLNLYEELIGTPGGHALVSTTLDSSAKTVFEDSIYRGQIRLNSKNKIKKYVKLNRLILKTNKLIRKQKCFYKNVTLRKQRLDLLNSIEIYSQKLFESRLKYDLDVGGLQADISELHRSLESLTSLYNSAQAQISEHILAADKLIGLVHHTGFTSLPTIKVASAPECCQQTDGGQQLPTPVSNINTLKKSLRGSLESNNVVIFSDSIGVGYGSLLNAKLKCKIINYCMPDVSFGDLVKSVMNCKLNHNSIVIIMLGNNKKLNKSIIRQNCTILSGLNVKKVFLCALPFSKNLSEKENNSIHSMNTLLFNITQYNDKFVFFDTNKFIDNRFAPERKLPTF